MKEVKALPSDVWFDILRRIPAAHLLRLKAVCKTFHLLISDDLFVQQHLNHFVKQTKPIIISTDPPVIPYQKTYDPDKKTISVWYDEPRLDGWCNHVYFGFDLLIPILHHHRIIDSYHGILLIQICDRPLLCNPITRSYKFLPSICRSSSNFGCLKLAYDDVSKQYKVFGLRRAIDRVLLCVFELHEINCETTAVKLSEEYSHVSVVDIIKESVLVNGNVYWLVIADIFYGDDDDDEHLHLSRGTWIVSANVTTEEVSTRSCLSTPFDLLVEIQINCVFAANGTFYQFGRSIPYYDEPLFALWILEGVENENPNPSWMMKHCIYTQSVTNSTLNNYPYFRAWVIGMFRDKILIIIEAGGNLDQVYQYDLSRKEFEEVVIEGNIKQEMRFPEPFRIVEHVDSLISL